MKNCPECGGDGQVPDDGDGWDDCPTCEGRGEVEDDYIGED